MYRVSPPLRHLVWRQREIENYICTERTLEAYAVGSATEADSLPLFSAAEADRRLTAMRESIAGVTQAMATLGKSSPWDPDLKVSDEFLGPLFSDYFERVALPNLMAKKSYYELVRHLPDEEIAPEISEKLDAIVAVSEEAKPLS